MYGYVLVSFYLWLIPVTYLMLWTCRVRKIRSWAHLWEVINERKPKLPDAQVVRRSQTTP